VAENKTNRAHVEGTRFYRLSDYFDVIRIVLVTFVIVGLLAFLALWFVLIAGARQAYKEARDIRKALRAVGTEYYGELSSIYDPNSSNGLADGAAEKIADISQRRGEVTLYEWDSQTNGPISFEYTTGLYRVVYVDTGSEDGIQPGVEGNFKVYYSFELLKYETE
jgi:hypothetical protein